MILSLAGAILLVGCGATPTAAVGDGDASGATATTGDQSQNRKRHLQPDLSSQYLPGLDDEATPTEGIFELVEVEKVDAVADAGADAGADDEAIEALEGIEGIAEPLTILETIVEEASTEAETAPSTEEASPFIPDGDEKEYSTPPDALTTNTFFCGTGTTWMDAVPMCDKPCGPSQNIDCVTLGEGIGCFRSPSCFEVGIFDLDMVGIEDTSAQVTQVPYVVGGGGGGGMDNVPGADHGVEIANARPSYVPSTKSHSPHVVGGGMDNVPEADHAVEVTNAWSTYVPTSPRPTKSPSPFVCTLRCFNGGTCIARGQRQYCSCLLGYSGTRCETRWPIYQPTPPPTSYRSPDNVPGADHGEDIFNGWPSYVPSTLRPTKPPTPQTEHSVLVKFFRNSGGGSWTNNEYWASENVNFCDWYGVECDSLNETVTRLELNSNSMSGRIDVGIMTGLPNLSVLDLGGNGLWGSIPNEIGNLKMLKSLTLANNQLRGVIPSSLSYLPMLEELDLSFNSFTYLGVYNNGYSNIRKLVLDDTYLKGTIPYQIFSMKALEVVSVAENSLTGTIPSAFSNLANLTKLDLHSNFLTGSLPNLGLETLEINVAGNMLKSIDRNACLNGKWNNGDVEKYGCDGIACPAETANSQGRQSSNSTPCLKCPSARFIGSLECVIQPPSPPPSSFVCTLRCFNGGTCTARGQRQYCSCLPGYSGTRCETRWPIYQPTPPPTSYRPSPGSLDLNACTFYAVSGSGRLSSFEPFCGGGNGYADLGPLSDIAVDPVTFRAIGLRESEMFEFYLKDGSLKSKSLVVNMGGGDALAHFGAVEFAGAKLYGAGWLNSGYFEDTTRSTTFYMMDADTLEITWRGPTMTETIVGLALWSGGKANTMFAVSPCKSEQKSRLYALDLDTNRLNLVCADMPACFESLTFFPGEDGGALYGGTNGGCIAKIIVETCSVLDCETKFGWDSHLDNVTGLSAICPAVPGSTLPPVMPYDPAHLTKFYESTYGSNWVDNTNWLSEKVDKCNWYGIECDDSGSIVGIHLSSNGLLGSRWGGALQYLDNFPMLKVLNISNNELGGTVPSFEKFRLLEVIDIRGTSISGTLPQNFLASAKNVQHIDLSQNAITGYLHSWSTTIPRSLKYLNLSSCRLGSSIPVEIGLNGVNLEVLDLSDNQFTFEFQESYYRGLRNLTSLRLSHNKLGGVLPSFEGAYYPKLREVDVSYNNMKGEIPKNLFDGNQLTESLSLDISHNEFGFIFPDLELLEAIDTAVTINAVGNRFEGLDESVCEHTNWNNGDILSFGCDGLMCPPMTSNSIGRQASVDSPCVPCKTAEFYGTTGCPLDALVQLYENTSGEKWTRSDNWLTNPNVCEWYGVRCNFENKVTALILQSNGLKGHFDTKLFAQLPAMANIDLSENALTSFDFCSSCFPNLRFLDLRNNELSGQLPSFFGLPKLENILLGNNSLTGTLSSRIGFPNLIELDLSSNLISGMLVDFNAAPQLRSLNLTKNDLFGTIAANFMRSSFANPATTYKSFLVDVSFNHLEGTLPSLEIENLMINVAGNMLSGLDQQNCDRRSWNERGVAQFGCDAIACPIGTANAQGRQAFYSSPCRPCSDAIYIGSVDCIENDGSPRCPDDHRCQNGATCDPSTVADIGYTCDCQTATTLAFGVYYAGQFCDNLVSTTTPTSTNVPINYLPTSRPVEDRAELSTRPNTLNQVDKTPALSPPTIFLTSLPTYSKIPTPDPTIPSSGSKIPTSDPTRSEQPTNEEPTEVPFGKELSDSTASEGPIENPNSLPSDSKIPTSDPTRSEPPSSKEPTNVPSAMNASKGTEKDIYYPNFSNGLCLNNGKFPLDVSQQYQFHNATECCEKYFPTNMGPCLQASLPTASPTPFGDGDWYPDYENHVCKNDGQQGPFEINFFHTNEKCCEFELIYTEKCLEAMGNSKQLNEDDADPDDEIVDFSNGASKNAVGISMILMVSSLSKLLFGFHF